MRFPDFKNPMFICELCKESFARRCGSQKFCAECSKIGHKLSKIRRGTLIRIGVGTGNGRDSGPTHQSWTTGIKAYRSKIKSECERCKSTENLCVHHKDHNRYHNEPSNWETLCKSCHGKEHARTGIKLSENHRAALRAAWVIRKQREGFI